MTGPSTHLTWTELACKDGTPYPAEWRETRAVDLAHAFERVRAACGGHPLTVLSAYRSPAHNRAIGGAPKSQHVEGRAVDVRPPAGMAVETFAMLIKANAAAWGIRGVGVYRTFVHLDTRPTTRLVAWGGTGAKDDA